MQKITVSKNEAGQRADKLLGKILAEAPKSFLYKMMRKKNITLNKKKMTGQERLIQGDEIYLFLSDDTIAKFSGKRTLPDAGRKRRAGTLPVLYEDEDVLFINKPCGMLSQKAKPDDFSLTEYLTEYLLETGSLTAGELKSFRPGICNRLDRNTSGIVAAGKSLRGLQELSRMLRERTMKKFYRTIVCGQVTTASYISGYLKKDEKTNRVEIKEEEFPGSVPIETEYFPLLTGKEMTLLEVHLITGRSHQIRAHLASQGHPVAGDCKYGRRSVNERLKKEFGLTHQLLHAYRMEFPEQATGLSSLSGVTVTAPVPELFRKIQKVYVEET